MARRGKELLSVREVMNARDGEHRDGGGLLMRCSGENAAWVFRYTAATGKRREMGLGTCERNNAQVAGASVRAAREAAAKARAMLAEVPPRDPITERERAKNAAAEAAARRKAEKQSTQATLAREARSYHEKVIEPTRNRKLARDWINRLETHVPKEIWHKPIGEVTRLELLEFLRDHQREFLDTAQRTRVALDDVFENALERGLVTSNPVAELRTKLRRENKPAKRRRNFPAMPYLQLPDFMARLRQQPGIAARCLEFVILTASRTGEAVGAAWAEIDSQQGVWTVPGARMKAGEGHVVHLVPRALEIIEEMRGIDDTLVFPSPAKAGGTLSNMALLALLQRRMEHTDIVVHGFRSSFSTWANETGQARPDVIEAALAHREGDRIRASYNRATFMAERRELLDRWAAFLDGKTPANNVVTLEARAA
jgi:integrase